MGGQAKVTGPTSWVLVAPRHDLEEQVCALLVDGEVAELVAAEEAGGRVELEGLLQASLRLGRLEVVDDPDGGGEEPT
jgi:hypothetical protein